MGIISILLLVIFVISAILLMLLVLIQDEQGEGLGGIFGGGSSTPIGNRSGNILTRTTSILGAIFLVCAFGLAWMNRTPDSGNPAAAARKIEAQQQGGVEWWKTNPNAATDGAGTPGTQSAAPAATGTGSAANEQAPAGQAPTPGTVVPPATNGASTGSTGTTTQ